MMKLAVLWAIYGGAGIALAVTTFNAMVEDRTQDARNVAAAATKNADVTALVDLIRPMVKDASSRSYYGNGLAISFLGSGVTIKMELPNGNKYESSGTSLREAVDNLGVPSDDLRTKLQQWKAETK